MTKGSNVTEEQCEARQDKLFSRLNSIDRRLANIEGKIGGGKFWIATCISLAAVFIAANGGCKSFHRDNRIEQRRTHEQPQKETKKQESGRTI